MVKIFGKDTCCRNVRCDFAITCRSDPFHMFLRFDPVHMFLVLVVHDPLRTSNDVTRHRR